MTDILVASAMLTIALRELECDVIGPMLNDIDMGTSSQGGKIPRVWSFRGNAYREWAKDAVDELPELKSDSEFHRLFDGDCGCGGKCIEVSRRLLQKGLKENDFAWTLVTASYVNFMAAYVQTTIVGIPACIMWGEQASGRVLRTVVNSPAALMFKGASGADGMDFSDCD